jgi:hypothetical protein
VAALVCRLSEPFAEWFARIPAAFFRLLLATLSAPFPFSLFEISLAVAAGGGLYVLIRLVLWVIRRLQKKDFAFPKRSLVALFLAAITVLDLFFLTLHPCYFRRSTAEHMGLEGEIDEEAVFSALEALCRVIEETEPSVPKNEAGESLSPYTLSETNERVRLAADRFAEKHPFFQRTGRKAKTFLSSPLLTYTHISGVYGFFTGEANVNTNYPHFVVTATLGHEMCHARGIAPENECNFLAAVILMESGDEYLAFCGATSLMNEFSSLCKSLDKSRTKELLARVPIVARDQRAYSRFFKPYRGSVAAKVADRTNSSYLQSMGQADGTRSYSRIIRLTGAYFQKKSS